ncbi:MAG: hypothetical protein WCA16_20700 [Candidatus Sulfotelmatobacter sp.]
MKAEKSDFANELCLELKYCERCGGLRLRPVGSGQMFCPRCAGEMTEAEDPNEISYPRLPKGQRSFVDDNDNEGNDFEAGGEDLGCSGDSAEGVA